MKASRHIAVIGGGWAGCAAAVSLAERGHRVSLFEAGRTLGGRARQVELNGLLLDNGQHILLGAYSACLRIMRTVGINPDEALLRLPLQMRYAPLADGMELVAPRLPAPWHMLVGLLRAKGLTGEDKMALARFSSTARWMGWTLHEDCSVLELLERFGQTERIARLMWIPLCIAALNTPPERASAKVFLHVLRDSLGARRAASDMLIPRVDLTALFPQQAAAFITQRQGLVEVGSAIDSLTPLSDNGAAGWQLRVKQSQTMQQFDGVLIATSPENAADLLEGLADTSLMRQLNHEPITTCYLQYAPTVRLPQPFYALRDDPATESWGQFVFDRGQLSADTHHAGLLAVVVSAAGNAIAQGHATLADAIARQLAAQFGLPELASPTWSKLISDKRATFSCLPALARPDGNDLPAGLALAGDYLASDYPATLESAVQSGLKAANSLIASFTAD